MTRILPIYTENESDVHISVEILHEKHVTAAHNYFVDLFACILRDAAVPEYINNDVFGRLFNAYIGGEGQGVAPVCQPPG